MRIRLLLWISTLICFGATAFAQENQNEYLKLLGIAQKAAREQKVQGMLAVRSTSPASALTSLGLNRRFYEVGDIWTVAFTPSDEPMVRMSGAPEDLATSPREPFHFEYRVLEIDASRIAKIDIRQKVKNGQYADPRIDHQILYVNSQFVTVKRETFYRDGRAPRALLESAVSNIAVGFSAYPLDLPNLSSVEGATLNQVPAELKGKSIDLKKALDFQFQDLYARPVQAIWLDGEVWPVYMKNSAGIAVVVSQERAKR